MRWKEIKKVYPDQWVAIMNFKDDLDAIPNSMGDVFAVADSSKKLAEEIKKKNGINIPLSIEYTGKRLKNFKGGIWLVEDINSPETTELFLKSKQT